MAFYDIYHPQGFSSSSTDDSVSMTPRRVNAYNMSAPPSMRNDLARPVECNHDYDLDIYERTAALILARLKDGNAIVVNEEPVPMMPISMCPNSAIRSAAIDTIISSFQFQTTTTKRAIAEQLLAARVWQQNLLVSNMLNLIYAPPSI